MLNLTQTKWAALALLSGAATLLINGCKVDDRYSLDNVKDVDTEVTVFTNGLTFPLIQSTAKITVDSILRKAGVEESSFGEYLKADSDGAYYLSYDTQFSLRESIQELDLKDLVDISPVNFFQSISYELSSIDVSALKTDPQEFTASDKLDIITIRTGNFEPVSHSSVLLTQETVKDAADAASLFGMNSVILPEVDLAVDSHDARVDGAKLSDDIESIDEINMKKGSKIKVEVSMPGSIFTSGEITPDVKIDLKDVLTLADGTGSLDCSSMVLNPSNSFSASKTFEVSKLNAAKLTQDRTVGVTGAIRAKSLSASVAQASALSSDVMVEIRVSFVDFELESVYGKLKNVTYNLEEEGDMITFELPDEVENFGSFTIIPKGEPALTLSVRVPEIDGLKLETEDGVKLEIPEFIKLGAVPEGFEYDENTNILSVHSVKTADYVLPVDRIRVNPKLIDGKYVVQGRYAVNLALVLPHERMDIYKLTAAAGESFSVTCRLPEVSAAEVILDELSVSVEESSAIEVVKASDIPEMVKSVSEISLDGTAADISLNLRNLPDIGDGKFWIDLQAQLPDFVIPSVIDISGEVKDGKFSKSVPISKLDFSRVDIAKLRAEGKSIGGDVTVSGRIKAANPAIDIEHLSQTISGEVVLKIAGPNGKVSIGDIAARVDYQLDSSLTVDFFKLPESLEDSYLDLPNAELVATVVSNLAIPMSANLDLNGGMYDLDVEFPYSEDPAQSKTLENRYSLDLNPLISEGLDKLPVSFSINVSDEKDSHVRPDADYDMDVDLGFRIPVRLGNRCNVTYSDILDLKDDAETIAKLLKKNQIQIFGTVESTMPFSVAVKVELLKYSGGAYTVIPTAEPVETILAQPNGKNVFGVNVRMSDGQAVDGLSHIRFSFTLGADGSQLNEGDYILLEGLGVKAPEGVTLDISE